MKARLILVWTLLSCSLSAFAQDNITDLELLSGHEQWLKLLHYKRLTTGHDDNESYVVSDDFFLSGKKHADPLEELIATLDAINMPMVAEANNHAQCKFPARLMFLQQHLNVMAAPSFTKIDCPDYNNWRTDAGIHSISVIFASGYMSNPASMYGHLFLKLNRNGNKSDLLNYSLNYGAIVPDAENPIVYILRGIFGGYDAAYSDKQFYRHHHNYGDVELRDMWDYKLNLSAADMELLVAHIWELLPARFDYYFIDENCAFHIAKLLELILPAPIISDDSLWVFPSSVAKGIANGKSLNGELLDAITYIPSRESLLAFHYQQLSQVQQDIALKLIQSDYQFKQNQAYLNLDSDSQSQIVEALFQYQDVLKQKHPEQSALATNSRKLVRERLAQPPGKALKQNVTTEKAPPHLGMPPSKFSFGGLHHNDQDYVSTGFRMTYFDDLSNSIARSKFANLEMLDVEIIANSTDIKILKVDLIDIDSLFSESIDWSREDNFAWSVRAGYEQLRNDCIDCGIYFGEGELGKSYAFTNSIVYAMLGGKVYAGVKDDVVLTAKLGLITGFSVKLKAKIEIRQLSRVNLNSAYDLQLNAELNYNIAKDWEIRLQIQQAEATTIGLKFNYFWDF
ncbi:Lnb N-terminal periplasmic domain-containing protein [Thalassotalea sp. ND16A]|uniref:Lnb N-terminal periplasmic domain-containing protein n=1 Tax=Thalassotalea sp. ND16A TaxID=1535422 RepID=UPI00051A78D4|nr:DUF4105 domain-containing protein [Thalassotalea sp. ND16A]KGJ96691.1 hypothetical protein ND16A_1044 [Thalassotalea sp. ND16A]